MAAILAAVTGAVPLVNWLRRKSRERAAQKLAHLITETSGQLERLQARLSPYATAEEYLPERIRRPLVPSYDEIETKSLVQIDKLVKRAGDKEARAVARSVRTLAEEMGGLLRHHNNRYVEREVESNSALLLDDLQLNEEQRQAVVRDDIANLVIGGAGSGKTRVLTGRVRYLRQRGVPPEHILAVTFTNKARDEMRERLERADVPVADGESRGVMISTLHALGKRVVQASQSEPLSVADDRWTDSLVAGLLQAARKGTDSKLSRLYVKALANFHRNEDEEAPELESKIHRTLRGDHVRSVGERIIADFLFTHRVPYAYEARAEWATIGKGRDAYHPDFFLPNAGAYIEHWGVDREGNVPPWMGSSEEYRADMEWKRHQFTQSGKTLIQTYDYERAEGTLEKDLSERLSNGGVHLQTMTLDQLEGVSKQMKYIGSIIERLLGAFLTNARSLRKSSDEIRKLLRRTTLRVKHFGRLGAAILERYESRLAEEGRVDFADMLYQAADIVEGGNNPLPPFEHILVDEFQDSSAAMASLLKGLLRPTKSHLFAVGDDWQAIYGFAGGDVDYIVNFEDHFGPASLTMLDTNYRSPAVVVEAGAALISKNKKQLAKTIVIASSEQGEALLHEVPDDDAALVTAIRQLIRQELKTHDPGDILVLSRTAHLLGPLTEACKQANIPTSDPARHDGLGIRILTAHKSKGLEAPVLIVANVSDHIFGFPSKVENPDVIEPVRLSGGNDEAEERRLFYVVLTRAMKKIHLVARKDLLSPYIAEIEDDGGKGQAVRVPTLAKVRVGKRFSARLTVERLFPVSSAQARARIRQVGEFAAEPSSLRFTSWLPFNLETGATYALTKALKEEPYRGKEKVKLDRYTQAKLVSRAPPETISSGPRQLRPRPPERLRPRRMERSS